jgi:hypothetical protein
MGDGSRNVFFIEEGDELTGGKRKRREAEGHGERDTSAIEKGNSGGHKRKRRRKSVRINHSEAIRS